MQKIWQIRLFGDSIYLQSIAAGLQASDGVKILLAGEEEAPDLVLLAEAGDDLLCAVEALRSYPNTPVMALDMQHKRLTVLRASSRPLNTLLDLFNTIEWLADEPAGEPPSLLEIKSPAGEAQEP